MLTKTKIQHDQRWQYAMIFSYRAQHSHNLLPQMFIFLCVHQGSDVQQKHVVPPLTLPLATSFFPPSFLPPSPSSMHVFVVLSSSLPSYFLSLTTIGYPKAFPFTLSWSSPFFLFFIFHSTKRHLEPTSFLHTNPTSRWKLFSVEF